MRRGLLFTLAMLVVSSHSRAQDHAHLPEPAFAAEPLRIETALPEIYSANRELDTARRRWDAAKERLPQAAAWEDPRVGLDVQRSNRRLISYRDMEWSISQTLPVTGKLQQRKAAATADAAVFETAIRQIEIDLESRARAAYFRLAEAEAQLDVNARSRALLTQLLEITRVKYESGGGRQADVLMAETEIVRLAETRVDQLRTYTEAQSAMNTLMNRAPQIPLGHAVLPELVIADASLEALQARAVSHRPDLAVADRRIAAAQTRVGMAERERFPEPELRVAARQFNGSGLYNLREYDTGVFISLPWANRGKYAAAIREARKTVQVEQAERRALEVRTAGMVHDAWQRLQTYRHHVQLFRDRLLPLARQTVDAMRSSYEANRATLPEVLAAERTVQETESMSYHHLAEYFLARTELIPLIGAYDAGAVAAP